MSPAIRSLKRKDGLTSNLGENMAGSTLEFPKSSLENGKRSNSYCPQLLSAAAVTEQTINL